MEELNVVFPKKPKLYFEICTSTLVSASIVSTMPVANSTTTNANQQWAMLENNKTFGRLEAGTPWLGFFLHPITYPLQRKNSTFNQPEHLKCLFCGPIAPNVGSRKGIITYKTMNGISVFQKHLELLH
jgi:hypothetical protein